MSQFQLSRNPAGRLILNRDGATPTEVVPVRAFPIAAPDEGISLLDTEGHEQVWIERLSEQPTAHRQWIAEELAHREFTPKISRIVSVSSFATPSTWQVQTDRGATTLLLKAEDHIRRLPPAALLITDGHGISFLISNTDQLDAHSRKLLDRFL